MSEEQKTPLLEVKNIKKWFPSKKSPFSKEKVYIKAELEKLSTASALH